MAEYDIHIARADADRARALARKLHELRIFPTDDGARSSAESLQRL